MSKHEIDAILDVGRPLARKLGVLGVICLLAIGIPAILLAAVPYEPRPTIRPRCQTVDRYIRCVANVENSNLINLTAPAAKPISKSTDSTIKVHGHVLDTNGAAAAGARA